MRFMFIGGCPRSGTTLLASMLGNCPGAVTLPEAPFTRELGRTLTETVDASASERSTAVFSTLNEHPRFRLWGMPLTLGDVQSALDAKPTLEGVMEMLAIRFAAHVGRDTELSLVVQHDPSNIRSAEQLGGQFGESGFVHIVRDGRAVMNSLRALDWGPTSPLQAASFWLSRLAHGLALEASERAVRVRYEDLVEDPASCVESLAKSLDLPFTPSMAISNNDFLPNYTKKQHSLVGGKTSKSRTDSWRSNLPERHIEIFEHETGDMLPYLGYARMYAEPVAPTRVEKLRLKAVDMLEARRKQRRIRRRLKANI